MSTFCYVLLDCCYPFASFKVDATNSCTNVQIKVHSMQESGVGMQPPVGPLPLKLENNCQYSVAARTEKAASIPVGFTWQHGREAICHTVIKAPMAEDQYLEIEVAGHVIFAGSVPVDTNSKPMFKLQMSFSANEPGLNLDMYRSLVDNTLPHWSMCPLLVSVSDHTWLEQWQKQLDASDGVLVVYSEAYRTKCMQDSKTAVLREAARIIRRMQTDPTFQVFVLDPQKENQGCTALGYMLLTGITDKNSQGWLKFVKKHMSPWLHMYAF